jgi:hypothetical protein
MKYNNKQMARVAAEHLLAGAPENCISSQLRDLIDLELDDLSFLAKLRMPMDAATRVKVADRFGDRFVARLEKRYEIAQSIIEAEKEGIFDQIEDQANKYNLGELVKGITPENRHRLIDWD